MARGGTVVRLTKRRSAAKSVSLGFELGCLDERQRQDKTLPARCYCGDWPTCSYHGNVV
jgi:hypothetical protein